MKEGDIVKRDFGYVQKVGNQIAITNKLLINIASEDSISNKAQPKKLLNRAEKSLIMSKVIRRILNEREGKK